MMQSYIAYQDQRPVEGRIAMQVFYSIEDCLDWFRAEA